MNVVRKVASELLGLFVEDWPFALAIALWIAVLGALDGFSIGDGTSRAALLLLGLAAILLANVFRAAHRK